MGRFYYQGTEMPISTGITFSFEYSWNPKKQRTKDNVEVNNQIDDFEKKVLDSYSIAIKSNLPITNDYLKRLIKAPAVNNTKSFFDVYQVFVESHIGVLSASRVTAFKTIKKHLLDFQIGKIPFSFVSIDQTWMDQFRKWQIKQGWINNSIIKNFKILNKFLRWSRAHGYHDNRIFENYDRQIKEDRTDIIFLTEQELDILRKHQFAKVHHQQECDAYLLRCYTGLRYKDLKMLRPENIKDGFAYVHTLKTKDALVVPLSTEAQSIINKYIDNPNFLNIRENQKSNEVIKEIMEEAKFNSKIVKVRYNGSKRISKTYLKHKLLTTHTARKTFVTLSRKRGMADDLIMRITGIKDQKTLNKYKHIDSDQLKEAMLKAWK
jgi:site-specific recombinase XerD